MDVKKESECETQVEILTKFDIDQEILVSKSISNNVDIDISESLLKVKRESNPDNKISINEFIDLTESVISIKTESTSSTQSNSNISINDLNSYDDPKVVSGQSDGKNTYSLNTDENEILNNQSDYVEIISQIRPIRKLKTKSAKKDLRKKKAKLRKKECKVEPITVTDNEDICTTELLDIEEFELEGGFERFMLPETTDETNLNNDSTEKSKRTLPTTKGTPIIEEEEEEDIKPLSRKKLKLMNRMSLGELKVRVRNPDLVEPYDNCSPDAMYLLELKSSRNTVPVPSHWCHVGRYLQSKRGFCKPPFQLPDYLAQTGIMEIRPTHGIETKTLKQKMKEKIRPKVGMVNLDYQKLHDAFFKAQTKPPYTVLGDIYYQGKEMTFQNKKMRPGHMSDALREALGIPLGKEGDRMPPPYLIHQQRYGPPPNWPKLKIPGLNAPLPPGASYGYHRDGWGKPPVDENNVPIYGDAFDNAFVKFADRYLFRYENDDEEDEGKHWGEPDEESESEEESEDSEKEEEKSAQEVTKNLEEEEYVRRRRHTSQHRVPSDEGEISDTEDSGSSKRIRTPPSKQRHYDSQFDVDFNAIKSRNKTSTQRNKRDLYKILQPKRNLIGNDELIGSNRVYDFDSVSRSSSVCGSIQKPPNYISTTKAISPSRIDNSKSVSNSKRKYDNSYDEKKLKRKKHDFKF